MKKLGTQSYQLENNVSILETACIVGPKEKDGPLAKYFDKCIDDEFWGEESWEKAESKFVKETAELVINKSGLAVKDVDMCFAGDLINQCISSSFGLRDLNIPFFGVFGACSTFVETNLLGSIMIDGGFARKCFMYLLKSLLQCRKTISFSIRIRKSTSTFFTMDRHSSRKYNSNKRWKQSLY